MRTPWTSFLQVFRMEKSCSAFLAQYLKENDLGVNSKYLFGFTKQVHLLQETNIQGTKYHDSRPSICSYACLLTFTFLAPVNLLTSLNWIPTTCYWKKFWNRVYKRTLRELEAGKISWRGGANWTGSHSFFVKTFVRFFAVPSAWNKNGERERERDWNFIYWLISQMPATARIGSGGSQEPKTHRGDGGIPNTL